MSTYLSYMKAFQADLRQIAVWEPGSRVELGDYGEIRKKRWQRLGNIWDLIEMVDPKLREHSTAKLDRLSLGSAHILDANTQGRISGTPGNFGLSVSFKDKHSVFIRADGCETKAYKRLQAIAETLVQAQRWDKAWTFVSEVRSAKNFLVLLATANGARAQVKAKTTELLDAFSIGQISADSEVEISGSDVLQFIGQSGPINMSIIKIRSPLLGRDRTIAESVAFAEGKPSAEPVFIEKVTTDELLAGEEAL